MERYINRTWRKRWETTNVRLWKDNKVWRDIVSVRDLEKVNRIKNKEKDFLNNQAKMAVARTNIINFFSEEDFDKYFALHKEFAKSLKECGLLEATYVSEFYFTIIFFYSCNRGRSSRNFKKSKSMA